MNVTPQSFPKFKLNIFVLAIASLSSNAIAEEVNLEKVRVVGQSAQIDKALNEQRQSNNIKSVVHADDIGQLPDDNAAEALQRLPGVSVENDQGEGRFVTVRGLAPELNSVKINGTLIPSPESGTRAVALDVLPSELVQSLSVVKSLTPDMDANSLGGTIEVETLSGFDHDGLFYTGTIEGSHDTNVDETSPKVSGAMSDIFDFENGKLGIAAAASWQERDFGSDNVEADGGWDFDSGNGLLDEFQLRDYEITRERTGLGLNFDYQTNDYANYYLRTQYSEFIDTETRNRAEIGFEDPMASGVTANAEAKRELKDREETMTTKSFVLGGEKTFSAWTVGGQVGYARSGQDTPSHIAGASFETDDDISASYSGTKKPRLSANSAFYNTDNFELDSVEWEEQETTDTEKNIKLDLAKDFTWGGYDSQIKFGGKLSRRDKDNDIEAWEFDGDGETLTDFASGRVDYALGNYGTAISSSALKKWVATQDFDDGYDEEASRIGDYDMEEDIDAVYVMNTLDMEDWTFIAGVRYEHTDFSAKGTKYDDEIEAFSAVDESNDYGNILPSFHARYYAGPNTQIRAAYTESVVRPSFEALAPGVFTDGEEAEFGNPNLDPLESKNIDLGIEHYLGKNGAFSAFAFYKDIENFVYETDIAGTGIWADYDEVITYENGDNAEVYGLEFAYTHKLSWLPSPWNGLIVGANFTFSESDAEISGKGTTRDISLPGQSDRVGNFMLGWENKKLSMRLSTNYKSSYLSEIADIEDKKQDVYVDDQTLVDFNASYFLSKHAQLTFEAKNITDEPFYRYTGSDQYNAQYEEYGPSYKLSLTLTNF